MKKNSTMCTEIRCFYAEIPHAMWKLKLMGYMLDDIVKTRINATEYQITALKEIRNKNLRRIK